MVRHYCERCPGLKPHRAVEEIEFSVRGEPQAIWLCVKHRDEFLKMLRPWRQCARTPVGAAPTRQAFDPVASQELMRRIVELKERANEHATPVIVTRDTAMRGGPEFDQWRFSLNAHRGTVERGFDPLTVLVVAAKPAERFRGHDGAWCHARDDILTVVDEDKRLVITVYERFEYHVETARKNTEQEQEFAHARSSS